MALKTVYICPTDKSLQCSWEGASGDILDHFIMEHEELLLHSSEVDINLDISSENRLLFLDEEIYLIQIRIVEDILKIGLRYLGPKRLANNFSYDIVLKVDGQNYFYNYFGNVPSIFDIVDGFWNIKLHFLRILHADLNTVQCNFSISNRNEVLEDIIPKNEVIEDKIPRNEVIEEIIPKNEDHDNENDNSRVEEDLSDLGTVIEDDEIDDILNEDTDILRNSVNKSFEGDALDNISTLNFSLLENSSRHCRRYSSVMGIPEELFMEKETTGLSCSNCFINMLPPIYLCEKEHNICSDCRYESCKICYGVVTENRNKELEDQSRKCLHLCRYHSEGCLESFMYNEIRNHEMKCSFCIYKCIHDCTFKGKFSELCSHFKLNHSSCKIIYATPVDFPRNSEFFICDNKLGIFHCTSSTTKNSFRWVVFSLGPRDRKYSCELTFKGARTKDVLFLKKLEDQYSLAATKEDLRKMKVKDKNAVLTITSYFQ
ncbi:hypothetical protein HHI36_012845 [Cryptolaemus montrouzieri]|uniref:SIAH-type domain-containing protein n=1 Tax=Cryptolaemus montrouzieri TaxID=559131 RepID=A0ABD2NFW6_9CUCU